MTKNAMYQQVKDLLAKNYKFVLISNFGTKEQKFLPFIHNNQLLYWKSFAEVELDESYYLNNQHADGIALITGRINGNIEAIDFDTKHADQAMMVVYRQLIPESIQNKIVEQFTKSGGYHWIYTCKNIEGNKKLARNSKKETKIETRGEGGLIYIYPTKGYALETLDFETITLQERDTLMTTARQFDELLEFKDVKPKKKILQTTKFNELYDIYNGSNNYDIPLLLRSVGITVHPRQYKNDKYGPYQMIQRDGSDVFSGKWFLNDNVVFVFSTSTELEPEKAYNPSSLTCKVNFDNDWSRFTKWLITKGYGKDLDIKARDGSADVIDESVDVGQIGPVDMERLASYMLTDQMTNLKIGVPAFDDYFAYRKGAQFYCFIGKTNVGKTTLVMYLQLIAAIKFDWKFLMIVMENDEEEVVTELVQMYLQLNGKRLVTSADKNKAVEFICNHFVFYKEPHTLSVEDILKTVEQYIKEHHIDCVFIDPFNQLKIGVYEYKGVSKAVVDLYTLCHKLSRNVWISVHPTIKAQRGEERITQFDVEFGGLFANKADFFCVIERDVTSSVGKEFETEFYIDKVRSKSKGGKPTPFDSPLRFEFDSSTSSFHFSHKNISRQDLVKFCKGQEGLSRRFNRR